MKVQFYAGGRVEGKCTARPTPVLGVLTSPGAVVQRAAGRPMAGLIGQEVLAPWQFIHSLVGARGGSCNFASRQW